jgi:glycosyltransferase involved in cell wall biosynthesis
LIEDARVFVVVPAFREEHRIARVIDTVPAAVDHVVVVDDDSDDHTFDVAQASTDPRLVVLRHATNRGVGAAIVTGYRWALDTPGGGRDAFVVMAGDGQMDPRDLPALVMPIVRATAGYVKGNRFAEPSTLHAIPRSRYLGGRLFTALTRVALGVPVHDSQCGYTAISRDACSRIQLASLWPRFGYPNDLLAMVARAHIAIAEVPVHPLYPHTQNKLGARHTPMIAAVIARAFWRRVIRG